jgi:colicin import membrane protein
MAGSPVRSSMRGGRGRRAMADINVVPYIDVMLVLLVIFMVTAPLVAPSIVNLPTVGNASPQQQTPPVVVNIRADGNMSVKYKDDSGNTQQETMTLQDLDGFVTDREQSHPDQPVVISARPFRPPRERGTWRAFGLAVLMHVLLAFFLYHGIHWQNSTPAGAEAELWTDIPDMTPPPRPVAPPVPVTPAPPVPTEDADIALQQQKRKQEEAQRQAQLEEQQRLKAQQEAEAKRQQQLAAQQAAQLAAQKAAQLKQQQLQQQQQQQQAAAEKLKQQQLAEQKKQEQLEQQQKQEEQQKQQEQAAAQAKADAEKKAEAQKKAQAQAEAAKKLAQERQARLAAMQGLAGGSGSTGNGLAKSGSGSGSGGTATSPGYADKVRRAVRQNVVWASQDEGLETVVSVRCAPSGTLLSASIVKSSGNQGWDDAALRGVQKTNPMPLDDNGKAPASFLITLRPSN